MFDFFLKVWEEWEFALGRLKESRFNFSFHSGFDEEIVTDSVPVENPSYLDLRVRVVRVIRVQRRLPNNGQR